MPIQNSFIFREPQWGSPPESFIQKCWLVSEIQSFEVENYFLTPFSLWNCAFLTIFDFKALYFWNQSIFLNETFLIEVPWKWSYFGWAWQLFNACHAHFPKTLLFQKCPKNLTNFGKFKIFFCISCCNFIGLFNGILFVFILSVVVDTQKEMFLP